MRVIWAPLGASVLLALACGEPVQSPAATDSVVAPPENASAFSIVGAVEVQVAEVGRPFEFNVLTSGLRIEDARGVRITPVVAFSSDALGLAVSGTRVMGTPRDAGIVTVMVSASGENGQRAEARFPIIVGRTDLGEPALPAVPYGYSDTSAPLPHHVANSPQVFKADNTPSVNPITNAGAALGRVLFYDRRLSANDNVSCASCHQQKFSFGDTAAVSTGFRGESTRRHSMPLANTRFYRPARFFRDERAGTLEALVLQPISDQVEMGLPAELLVPKLRAARFYAPLFAAAFGDSAITTERTSHALAQFIRSLQSTNAKLDSIIGRQVPPSALESDGERVFELANCRSCHETYVAVSDTARNNGLSATNTDPGAGSGRFKAPSLRNVAVRPPYMHDGRFRTLEAVIDFYDGGIQDNPDLDRQLRDIDGRPRKFRFSAYEKSALMAFLHALTDRQFLSDPRFGNPFPTR